MRTQIAAIRAYAGGAEVALSSVPPADVVTFQVELSPDARESYRL